MNNRKITVKDEFEYVLERPEIFVGSCDITTSTEPVVGPNGHVTVPPVDINIGMTKLFMEVLDNAIDACKRAEIDHKRFKGEVTVCVDAGTNRVTISDNADGFYEAIKINDKSGISNIKTAYTILRSGTNFDANADDFLMGVNGVGGTLVNMLSDKFSVKSINKTSEYIAEWDQFKITSEKSKGGLRRRKTGTEVSFVPRVSVFGDHRWDMPHIFSKLCFVQKCLQVGGHNIVIEYTVIEDGIERKIPLVTDFNPPDSYIIDEPGIFLAVYVSPRYSQDILVINSTVCKGSPLMVINDKIDKLLKMDDGNHYYSIMLIMNTPRELTKFGDQNKTYYTIHRTRIEPYIDTLIGNKLHPNKVAVDDRFCYFRDMVRKKANRRVMNKLQNDIAKNTVQDSERYFSSTNHRDLFIVEGNSALGSILQGRDPKNHSMFALKGKIRNCSKATEVAKNEELKELMLILGLDFMSESCNYDRIIIATDADVDGIHISALLMHFFHSWFPHIIRHGMLYKLSVPLHSVGEPGTKNCRYFYDEDDWENWGGHRKHYRYLKGLGSLTMKDWAYLMDDDNMDLIQMLDDDPDSTDMWLDVAFGDKSSLRKLWLSGVENPYNALNQ